MTKAEAEECAKDLSPGYRLIGWKAGTCQSVFQFWTPEEGLTIELPHAEKGPTGRTAALMVQAAKKDRHDGK